MSDKIIKEIKETPIQERPRDEQIVFWYQRGKGSIQDIARIYNVDVDYVLRLIGEGHLGNVTLGGDMIDSATAGAGATMNYGKEVKIPFDLR